MDNLQLAKKQVIKVNISLANLHEICIDDNLCCFIDDNRQLNIYDAFSTKSTVDFPPKFSDSIVNISFLSIWKVVFIATESTLIAYDIAKSKFSSSEPNVKGKIIQASWNPAQTFVVVIYEGGALSGYSFKLNNNNPYEHQFVHVTDGLLEDKVPNSVYVGWGAQNTQFKGSKKHEETIKEIPQDYTHPNISWRGNGEMFVINYWKDNRRFLKVFDVNLQPLFGSEPFNNLLPQISFKGQGNFIACAATDGEINRIVIFEKNCFIKSSFTISENKGEIKDVQYHREKHMLAVHSQTSNESCLNIYSYANDTWYLKQQLCYPLGGSEKLLKFHWVADLSLSACKLNILTSSSIQIFDFTVETYGIFNDLVAVINGSKVSFSEFSKEIVPPPMASKSLEFERPVNQISFYPSEKVYEFSLSNSQCVYYKYEDGDFIKQDSIASTGNIYNNNMSSFQEMIKGNSYQICLNRQLDLTIDERAVMSNVSSVHVHRDYLLFTHISRDSYKLYSVRLTQETILRWNPDLFFCREVEQGSKIICVTDKDQIILIMPRGNLETITCRLIAIDTIESLLSQNDWCNAINQIRSQKLNWNLLIDLNKLRFVEHISDFIQAAKTVSLLNTIVTEFSTENCLETMYKAWSRKETSIEQHVLDNSAFEVQKIDILGTILKMLVQLNPMRNLLSLVTLQIKHYSIRAALKSVLQVFKLNNLEISKKAVAQIIRYKHINDVISTAYTLYDIDFLSFIYSCCSEDPRVFAPEIDELRTLNPIRLRFTMNVRGKEFERATKYLVRLVDESEAFISNFIKKHSTQSVAYNNVNPDDPHFKLVTQSYADYLGLKTKHNEAGLILERARLHEEALIRYKIARNWQKVINILNMLNVEDERKKQILSSLAQDLINHKQVEEGAHIYEHFCGDYKTALKVFIDHQMFQKAICLAGQYDSQKLIDEFIQPKLRKYMEGLYERILELGSKFSDYTTRLLLLREKKYKNLLRKQMIYDGDLEIDGTEFDGDTNSEYGSIISKSSMGSFSSGNSKSSSLSSRNRRKLERKKTDLREGAAFEDIALIRQLYLLAIDIFAAGQEVTDVCYSAIDEDSFRYCKMLHSAFDNIQRKVEAYIPKIWTDTFLTADHSTAPQILSVIENRHELDEQFRTPPTLKEIEKLQFFSINKSNVFR